MKTNGLLIAAAIYLALVGLGFLLVPGVMVFGALGGTPATIVAELRQYGGALLGIAALNWVARNAEVSTARNGVFLGNTVGFALVAVGGVLRQLSGAIAVGWVFVMINALFAIAFFLVGRANMSQRCKLNILSINIIRRNKMSTEQNKSIVRRWVEEGWNKHDLAVIDELYAPNFVQHEPEPQTVNSSEALKQYVGAYLTAFPDLHLSIEDLIAEGDKVVWRFNSTGHQNGSIHGHASHRQDWQHFRHCHFPPGEQSHRGRLGQHRCTGFASTDRHYSHARIMIKWISTEFNEKSSETLSSLGVLYIHTRFNIFILSLFTGLVRPGPSSGQWK